MSANSNIQVDRVLLQDVANIQPGYLSRSRVRGASDSRYRLLQAKDISREGRLHVNAAIRFQPERVVELYLVSRGDILFVARGSEHRSYLIELDLHDTLASNVFYIIRSRSEIVLPGYLAWWLNQGEVQAAINASSCGTDIGYISRQSIEQLPVVLPPISVQHRIAEAQGLWRRRRAIDAQLNEKRQLLIEAICRRAVRQQEE